MISKRNNAFHRSPSRTSRSSTSDGTYLARLGWACETRIFSPRAPDPSPMSTCRAVNSGHIVYFYVSPPTNDVDFNFARLAGGIGDGWRAVKLTKPGVRAFFCWFFFLFCFLDLVVQPAYDPPISQMKANSRHVDVGFLGMYAHRLSLSGRLSSPPKTLHPRRRDCKVVRACVRNLTAARPVFREPLDGGGLVRQCLSSSALYSL